MILTYEIKGRVTDVEFDAVVHHAETSTATVTEHPIEKGSNVNDHVRQQPDRVSAEAVVSDTPLASPSTQTRGVKGSTKGLSLRYDTSTNVVFGAQIKQTRQSGANVLQFDGRLFRIKDVYAELRFIKENAIPVSIKTVYQGGLSDWEDMVIVGLGAQREAKDGSARAFNLDFQSLRIVETQKVAAPKSARKRKGEKGKREVKPEKEPQLGSVLHAGKEGGKKYIKQAAAAFGL
jgi:hypothetical protein